MISIGDIVRVISIPPDLPEGEIGTRSLFALCVGRSFPVISVHGELLELHVGEVLKQPAYLHSIWIEFEHVEHLG